jgi:hypothetical protein
MVRLIFFLRFIRADDEYLLFRYQTPWFSQ